VRNTNDIKSYFIVVVVELNNTEPFRSVLEWREELEKYCEENIPVILVGCKSDLPNHAPSYEQIKVQTSF
jgi:GTPase SAR1 family protein